MQGGSGGSGGSSGGDGGSSGGDGGVPGSCQPITVTPYTDKVVVLVDLGTKMGDPFFAGGQAPRLEAVHDTLLDDDGIILTLQGRIAFGFAGYGMSDAGQCPRAVPACSAARRAGAR